MLTRRTLLENLLRSFDLRSRRSCPASSRLVFSIRLAHAEPTAVPANFTGLGYEMSSAATPGLLRFANHRYIELVRGPAAVVIRESEIRKILFPDTRVIIPYSVRLKYWDSGYGSPAFGLHHREALK